LEIRGTHGNELNGLEKKDKRHVTIRALRGDLHPWSRRL
jgi:hypothetical protein